MPNVTFQTLGCKLNQSETASLVKLFKEKGYQVVSEMDQPDLFILNTCTVTRRSDAKCRQTIRSFLKKHPMATVVIVGCYSQVAADELATIPGVDYILGSDEKFDVLQYMEKLGKKEHPEVHVNVTASDLKAKSKQGDYQNQTRAFVKIQDGCDNHCTYCIVPRARGHSRSVESPELLNQVQSLIADGFKEIVLSGVHIGQFGIGHHPKNSLANLLQAISSVSGDTRIRLSSLEPSEVTDELLDVIQKNESICRHFHIPLQSGSNRVLHQMGRKYSRTEFIKVVKRIEFRFNHFGLGTDVIVGFPGESDEDFKDSFEIIQQLPFSYLHVFPYSIRKSTPAAAMEDQVLVAAKRDRAKKLRDLGQRKKRSFMNQFLGNTVNVLFEDRNFNGWMGGFTSEYLRVEVAYNAKISNKIVPVKIEEVVSDCARGQTRIDRP